MIVPIEPSLLVILPVRSPVTLVVPVMLATLIVAADPPAETVYLARAPSAVMLPPVAPLAMRISPMVAFAAVSAVALMVPEKTPPTVTLPIEPPVSRPLSSVDSVPVRSPAIVTALMLPLRAVIVPSRLPPVPPVPALTAVAPVMDPTWIVDPASMVPLTVSEATAPVAMMSEPVIALTLPLKVMAPMLTGSMVALFIAAPPTEVTVVVPITLPVMLSLTLFIASAPAAVPAFVIRMLPVTSPATSRAVSVLITATTVGTVAPAPVVWAVKEARSFPTEMRLALLVAKLSALPVVLVRRIAPMSLPEVIVVAFPAASAKADPLMAVAVMLTMSVSASNIDDTMPAPRGVFDAVVAWITPIVPTVELTVRFAMALPPLRAVTAAVIGPTFAPWKVLKALP